MRVSKKRIENDYAWMSDDELQALDQATYHPAIVSVAGIKGGMSGLLTALDYADGEWHDSDWAGFGGLASDVDPGRYGEASDNKDGGV